MPPNSQDFQNELDNIFASARRQGKKYVEVKSGDLHRRVGGYPRSNHRMPLCCRVMKINMNSKDKIIQEPPREQGATLIIRYNLPR